MIAYALAGLLLVQRLGGENDEVRSFIARYLLGIPAPAPVEQVEPVEHVEHKEAPVEPATGEK